MGKYDYDASEFDGGGSGLALPFIQIRQKELKSADGKQILQPAGNFKYNDDTPDTEEIEFVLLFSHKGRSHWLPGADLPDCKSNNAIVPTNPEKCYCSLCENCDESVWHGTEKPACQENIQMCILQYSEEKDEFVPYILQVKGKGMKPARDLINSLKKHADSDDAAPWHYPVKASTKYVQEKGYTYYVNVFDCGKYVRMPEEFIERLDAIREDLLDPWKESIKVMLPADSAPALTGRDRAVGQLMSGNEDVDKKPLEVTTLGGGDPFKLGDDPFEGE